MEFQISKRVSTYSLPRGISGKFGEMGKKGLVTESHHLLDSGPREEGACFLPATTTYGDCTWKYVNLLDLSFLPAAQKQDKKGGSSLRCHVPSAEEGLTSDGPSAPLTFVARILWNVWGPVTSQQQVSWALPWVWETVRICDWEGVWGLTGSWTEAFPGDEDLKKQLDQSILTVGLMKSRPLWRTLKGQRVWSKRSQFRETQQSLFVRILLGVPCLGRVKPSSQDIKQDGRKSHHHFY